MSDEDDPFNPGPYRGGSRPPAGRPPGGDPYRGGDPDPAGIQDAFGGRAGPPGGARMSGGLGFPGRGRRSLGGGTWKIRLLIALAIAAFSLFKYWTTTSENPVTGEKQHVALTVDQEIALGLQAAPEMAAQFGGASRDAAATERVQRVGRRLLEALPFERNPYRFAFHLLADPKTVNAFALPGGQIFITTGLATRLSTEGELAGVLAHEIGHVIERHSAERMAKQALTQGITMGAIVAASDPNGPMGGRSDVLVRLVANFVSLKYGRDDELESDRHGVGLLAAARYDPRAMLGVMKTLAEAAGGSRQPDFASSHPSPENRIGALEAEIARRFPQGVPAGLDR